MKKFIFLCFMVPSFVFAESNDDHCDKEKFFEIISCTMEYVVYDENNNPTEDENGKLITQKKKIKMIT